ncbi:MAG: class I SAM-dependent methyltransferase [Bryobacteraceae bacterium]
MKAAIHKTRCLLGVLMRNPSEFVARVDSIVDARLSGAPVRRGLCPVVNQEDACRLIGEALDCDPTGLFRESALEEVEREIAERMEGAESTPAIPLIYSADRALARFCYVLCRLKRPKAVIETGVSYGVTSAYLLQAMQVNGCGTLASIDLPPLGADATGDVGRAVPERLRGRWRLQLGSSRQWLGRVASELAPVDIFIHDSLHTYRMVKWELETVAPFMAEDGVGICDDIEGNAAFEEWLSHGRVASAFAVRAAHKADSLFGISLLGPKRIEGGRSAGCLGESYSARISIE